MQKALQVEAVDIELRNALWTAWHEIYGKPVGGGTYTEQKKRVLILLANFWVDYLKRPSDQMPHDQQMVAVLRDHLYGGLWNEVFDILEFVVAAHPEPAPFISACNRALEQENSAYRFVGSHITSIVSKEEIAAVETAIESAVSGARIHLSTAVAMLSDRKNPDYRNSIKESISAVESMCRVVAGKPGATLGAALKPLKDKAKLHPAIEKAFSSLYGYTSDQGGIRHALMDEPNLSFSEAKFMLVACSGFINYLLGKAAELGIEIPKD